MISIENISKRYPGQNHSALENVSLTINSHEFVAILGASGSGKSTLLKMINRLITPSSGRIYIDDTDIMSVNAKVLRRNIGYVFQHIGLFPHMTIFDNLNIVLKLHHQPHDSTQQIKNILEQVNIDYKQYAHQFPDQLSGGQQQRIGVARALISNPNILLMDEPFGAIDPINRNELQDELRKLHQHLKKTTLFVTHDIAEAFKLADRIAIFNEGKLQQFADKSTLLNAPASDYVYQLITTQQQQLQHLLEVFS